MKRLWLSIGILALALPACKKFRPTYPGNRVASSLQHMCSTDYRLSVETRHADAVLQALVWKVGLFKGQNYDLQAINRDALDAMDHVLLCATRVVLSTDAPLQFIEIKIADVLTGSSVTLWRYVPDIRDSMYQRIGDTEYFNRLVIEVNSGDAELASAAQEGHRMQTGTELKSTVRWGEPITMSEFIAKQVILRARREGGDAFEAHPDLSEPSNLGVVIDNWNSIQQEGPEHAAKVRDLVHKSAQKVIKGYRFSGFHGMTLRDGRGVALNHWTL